MCALSPTFKQDEVEQNSYDLITDHDHIAYLLNL